MKDDRDKLNELFSKEHDWYNAFKLITEGFPELTYETPTFHIEAGTDPVWEGSYTVKAIVHRKKILPPEPGLWAAFVRARTPEAVQRACARWARWLNPEEEFSGYPKRLAENAAEFLKIKKDERYPKSLRPSSDEKRLEFFARGMAGVDLGMSPITAIDRLRKVKHIKGCPCWRCAIRRGKEFEEFVRRNSPEEKP